MKKTSLLKTVKNFDTYPVRCIIFEFLNNIGEIEYKKWKPRV